MIFIDPWEPFSPNQAATFIHELAAELSPEHPLHGIALQPVAHSCRADDVLFGLDDGRVIEVHLTWSEGPERPPFPVHRIFGSLDDWAHEVMFSEHTDPAA